MFCSKCGNQLPVGAGICPKCGVRVEKGTAFANATNHTEQKSQQIANGVQNQTKRMSKGIEGYIQSQYQSYKEQRESRKIKDVHEIFVNPDEEERAVIGREYMDDLVATGILTQGFSVLTNHRFYYKGQCYYKVGGHYTSKYEERTVDVQDVTSSGFTYTRQLIFIYLAVCAFMGFLFFMISASMSNYSHDAETSSNWAIFCLILMIAFIAGYIFLKRAMYEVTFAGGSLAIEVSSYSVKDIKAFDKSLHLAKDEYLAKQRQ